MAGLFTIRTIRLSNHGRIPVLMRNDTGFPVPMVTRYVATELWNKESENTTRSRLNAIKALYEWALSLPLDPFDPEQRFAEPDPMDISSIKALTQYLRIRRKHEVFAFPQTPSHKSVGRNIVADGTVAGYLASICDYAVWGAQTQARPLMLGSRVAEMREWFKREIRSFQVSRRPAQASLTAEQQNRLRDICRPDSPENPFNKPVRLRNQSIVHLLLNAPLRKGELVGLRMQDVNLTGGGRFSVTVVVQDEATPSTAFDTRKNRPRQKTRGREIPIVAETKDVLLAYLKKERPPGSKSPFFFLSSRGGVPLSLGAPNNMFKQLETRLGPGFPALFPHLTRHTFNYNFKLHNLAHKLKDGQDRQVQNYLNGWSDTSTQADAYGSAANVVIADHFVTQMHAKIKKKA